MMLVHNTQGGRFPDMGLSSHRRPAVKGGENYQLLAENFVKLAKNVKLSKVT